jgi:hypothetical protein
MIAPEFRRKLKDRQLTVELSLGGSVAIHAKVYGELALVDREDCRISHRYRTQLHIVPETRKLGQQSYIANSCKAPTECPPQQHSNFQRPWPHLDCIPSSAPSCSSQDNVKHLTASLMDKSVIQALSNICRQPQIRHTNHQ